MRSRAGVAFADFSLQSGLLAPNLTGIQIIELERHLRWTLVFFFSLLFFSFHNFMTIYTPLIGYTTLFVRYQPYCWCTLQPAVDYMYLLRLQFILSFHTLAVLIFTP